MKRSLESIGRIRTPYRTLEACPCGVDPEGPMCEVVVDEAFAEGLSGIEAGHAVLLLYWFDDVDRHRMIQRRRGEGELRGVFALRSPHRPNPIAASVVTVERIDGRRLFVRGMDCLDGTPLLDIKPASSPELEVFAGTGSE